MSIQNIQKEWKVREPVRLLTFLKKNLSDLSLSNDDLHWGIAHHRCWVNDRVERFASHRLQPGDRVLFWPIHRQYFLFDSKRILFEDSDCIAYDKPPHFDTPFIAQSLNTLLVHRLDRDTSGIVLFAKHVAAQKALEDLFRQRSIKKTYHVFVKGILSKKEGMVSGYMMRRQQREGACSWKLSQNKQGLFSKTFWKREAYGEHFSYLSCFPHTGRTHQIRIHLASIGHPILGDVEYGEREGMIKGLFRPLLHASQLSFIHPVTHEPLTLQAPLPEDFLHWKHLL